MIAGGVARPRLLIGGVQSGVGKSTITLALVAALRRRGLTVQTFKVGPDYLDPGHLAQVSGRPCYNLDSWMSDPDYLRELFIKVSMDADISLVEGVMGLFDGSSSTSLRGSSAEIAALLQIPAALVVNVHGMARSLAALVSGYQHFEPSVTLAGVLANRCGSPSHARLLGETLAAAELPPLLGAIPRNGLPELPSRHLGLVSALEQGDGAGLSEELAAAAEAGIDFDLLLQAAARAPLLADPPAAAADCSAATPVRLGVAWDEAFQFYYADLFPALRARGCEPVLFSPLRDQALPANLAGLYLGGGYPEVHAEQLAANREMLAEVQTFCASGKPVYAECGGLIYLSQGVEDAQNRFPLVGCLPVWTRLLEKRKALGYVTATLTGDSLFGRAGESFRGHEFHYSELLESPVGTDGWQAVYQLTQNRGGKVSAEGFQRGRILASYAHLQLASQPAALDWWIATMLDTAGQ